MKKRNKKYFIYTLTNKSNGKVYIGSTVDIIKREKDHFRALKRNKHSNTRLQNSYNKYGKRNFKFEILDTCDKEFLLDFENFWINMLDAYDDRHGYNIKCPYSTPTRLGKYHSDKSKKKISESKKGRKRRKNEKPREGKEVFVRSKINGKVTRYISIAAAARHFRISPSCMKSIIQNEKHRLRKTKFRYVELSFNRDMTIDYKNCYLADNLSNFF